MTTKQEPIPNCSHLLSVCLVVASLYFAREVFIPLALAILFAFLLEPLAGCFERAHLGRVASALAAVFVVLLVLGTLFYCLTVQFGAFGKELPKYENTIHEKIRQMGTGYENLFGQAVKSMATVRADLAPTNAVTSTNDVRGRPENHSDSKAGPMDLSQIRASAVKFVGHLAGPSMNVLMTLFLVIVFCVFFLVGRDDLRARLIRIVGSRHVKVTRQLLDETAQRLSRYLLMQLIVNASYGVAVWLGLWAIGIPNPLLWGMIAAVFRYIPYAGPWIAASLPLAVAFAISTGWSKPALVLGFFAVLEILTGNLFEPWLYGSSTGITPIAVLFAAVFWTWLWGPIGLLLSMPLTVCLISIARHVPELELLDQLFGETES